MGTFSFDIESTYDIGEMNNVYDQTQRELGTRYDLKGTHAQLEWLDDKKGLKIYGDNQYHLDAIIEMLRKKAGLRGVSQKSFDVSKEPETTNLRMIWEVPLKNGLKQDDAKKITKILRDELPKVKAQIQGDSFRVMSAKKDELQMAMQLIKSQDLDFPVIFTNFR
ncbi:MAG: YajQ family cyclic di-GMP-binding protein [Candidatus Saccharibacteria bacterium]|nr:YajQ family cyclic di-GMP-binding protein [Candidatus Saccharibacteria bacterium]